MTHLPSILWLISWPVLIYVTYLVSVFALKKLESNLADEDKA
jgi:hypothetical protein